MESNLVLFSYIESIIAQILGFKDKKLHNIFVYYRIDI